MESYMCVSCFLNNLIEFHKPLLISFDRKGIFVASCYAVVVFGLVICHSLVRIRSRKNILI
jgi:hypothetical protein